MREYEAIEKFNEMLNEVSEVVNVCGYLFEPARALRELDPIAYRCEFSNWADSEGIDTDKLAN